MAMIRGLVAVILTGALIASTSCRRVTGSPQRTFATPEEGVQALIGAVATENVGDLLEIFAPDGRALVDLLDPASARLRRQVFVAATRERWAVIDQGGAKVLVVGNEQWPFPVPLVSERNRWRFDTAAGKEEVMSRRIGRNELFVVYACRGYVARPDRPRRDASTPYHGYYFRVLAGDGSSGKKLALVAWPAEYDVTGVMTFVVGSDGIVHQKDLGADTATIARAMPAPVLDGSWMPAQ
jgi:hypothetical protein